MKENKGTETSEHMNKCFYYLVGYVWISDKADQYAKVIDESCLKCNLKFV